MTAVIGILNKSGVALAADSAITISSLNHNKIYNTANKIFTLSKCKPVAVMIYSSANFMSVPWETIIKLYREKLADQAFKTIKEYQKSFIEFLEEKNFFISEENQSFHLKQFVYNHLNVIKKQAIQESDSSKEEDDQVKEIIEIILDKLQKNIDALKQENEILTSFKDYKIEDFREYAKNLIEESFNLIFEDISFPSGTIDILVEHYYHYIKSKHFLDTWTGLVFTGFGEDEIYPQLISLKIAEVFDGRLRYYIENSQAIDEQNTGSIVPYAQTDVIQTLIEGVNPSLNKTFVKTFEDLLQKYNEFLINKVEIELPEIAEKIKNIDITELSKKFEEELIKLKEKQQIAPTVNTVAILSKEDLAEMAESLVYLTYLKRRISSDEESVGGPIDVAIISKGDGFIWKKRKHYFDPELNAHFFENYFKNLKK